MLAHLGCLDSRAHRTSPISSSPSVSLWRAAAKGKTEFAEADAGRRKVRIKNAASCGLPHTSATSLVLRLWRPRGGQPHPAPLAPLPARDGASRDDSNSGAGTAGGGSPPTGLHCRPRRHRLQGAMGASRHAHDQRRLPKQNETAQSPTAQITGPPLSPVSFNHVRQEKINHVSGVLRS